MGNKLQMQDLADAIVASSGCTKKSADLFIRTMFDMIEEFLETDEFVKIKGFGTFKLIQVDKRESINVNTGERFQIEGHSKVSFVPDASLKELINKPFAQFQSVAINDDTNFEEIEQTSTIEEDNQSDDQLLETDELAIDGNQPPETEEDKAEPEELESNSPENITKDIVDTPETDDPQENKTDSERVENLISEEETNKSLVILSETSNEIISEEVEESPVSIEKDCSILNTVEQESNNTTTVESSLKVEENDSNEIELETEKPHQSNGPKIIKRILFIVLLVVLISASYVAGYMKMINIDGVLCFRNSTHPTEKIVHPATENSAKSHEKKIVPQKKDSIKSAPQKEVSASSMPSREKELKTKQVAASGQKSDEATSGNKSVYKQVSGAKYRIVGTKTKYTVQSGETLRNIAHKHYGSKGYAQYIIAHNNIKDPDNVLAGDVLKLPELEENN